MIDNRPKVHRYNKNRLRGAATEIIAEPAPAAAQAEIHTAEAKEIPPLPADKPVRAKAAPASPLGGLGKMLGGLGGGVGNLLGGLGGGGIGTVLPVVLAVSALQRGRGQPAQPRPAAVQPAAPPVPVEAPKTAPEVKAAASPRAFAPRQARRKTPDRPEAEKAPEPLPEPDPVPVAAQRPSPPPRPAPKPAEIRNLLSDISGYLPGTGGSQVSKISRIFGIADDLKSINEGGNVFAASAPADPLDRSVGMLSALGRHLPFSGASNLSTAGQVLSVVNTLRGTIGGGGGGGLGGLGALGNLGNMAGMFSGMGSKPAQPSPTPMKNVSPAQTEGLKNTVNRLLSGMDDKQKSELLDRAKDFLGKK